MSITLPVTTPPDVRHRTQRLNEVPPGSLLIHEIYASIQGESTFAGLPCVFIRTSVCDLRCHYCDTPHAFTQGTLLTRESVLAQALAFGIPLVELTGGEPLLQPEVFPLMTELAEAGCTVLLETSGAHDIAAVDPRVHIIMDLKTPDSGEVHRNYWPNLERLKPTDQIKFVLVSEADWEWARGMILQHRLDERFPVLVSTAFGELAPARLVELLLESRRPGIRMQLQLHKYIWDPKARGV
jgi:7-carboxy-7-deazaguanine synthase